MSNTIKTFRIQRKQFTYRLKRSFFYREILLLAD
jgi:hypothetical protein